MGVAAGTPFGGPTSKRLSLEEQHRRLRDASYDFVKGTWDAVEVRVYSGVFPKPLASATMEVETYIPGMRNSPEDCARLRRSSFWSAGGSRKTAAPAWNQQQLLLHRRDAHGVAERRVVRFSLPGMSGVSIVLVPAPGIGRVTSTLSVAGGKVLVAVRAYPWCPKTAEDLRAFDQAAIRTPLASLSNGDKALLRGWRDPSGNRRAILWFPGLNDSFHHPAFARRMLQDGCDVYVLDVRRCGACRRAFPELCPPDLLHYTADFKESIEEIRMALDCVIHGPHSYPEGVVGYAHSTGALYLLAYLLHSDAKDSQFAGFVFNSPFFDWGRGSFMNKLILRSGVIAKLVQLGAMDSMSVLPGSPPLCSAEKPLSVDRDLDVFKVRLWQRYGVDAESECLFGNVIRAGWVKAVTEQQQELRVLTEPATMKPFLVLCSPQDDLLVAEDVEASSRRLGPNRTLVEVPFACHDTLGSFDEDVAATVAEHVTLFLRGLFRGCPSLRRASSSIVGSFHVLGHTDRGSEEGGRGEEESAQSAHNERVVGVSWGG